MLCGPCLNGYFHHHMASWRHPGYDNQFLSPEIKILREKIISKDANQIVNDIKSFNQEVIQQIS